MYFLIMMTFCSSQVYSAKEHKHELPLLAGATACLLYCHNQIVCGGAWSVLTETCVSRPPGALQDQGPAVGFRNMGQKGFFLLLLGRKLLNLPLCAFLMLLAMPKASVRLIQACSYFMCVFKNQTVAQKTSRVIL